MNKKELIEQQNDELNKLLEQQKQEEDIDWDQINDITRKANELTKNINSRSPTNLRKFAPRRDPFDHINENKTKVTPSPSKILAPIPKLREPQGVAVGEQAGIAIMTKNGQVKILDDKIKANNAQYNLDVMNAEISAYSSGNLPKYEYLTNKDLGYKPDAFEQA